MKHLIVLRGGGDISTGIASTLWRVGYRVLILEQPRPSSIRREASFADAVYQGEKTVERVTCRCATGLEEALDFIKKYRLAMLVDPQGRSLYRLKDFILVDAVNDAEDKSNWPADFVIGLGEGFCAGQDVDCVIELGRSFNMGRVIGDGRAKKLSHRNSLGDGTDAILTAPVEGNFTAKRTIASIVKTGDLIGEVIDDNSILYQITSPADGVLRGIIHDGYRVAAGMDVAEVDMRILPRQCFKITDRARTVAGGVLEAILRFENGLWEKSRSQKK